MLKLAIGRLQGELEKKEEIVGQQPPVAASVIGAGMGNMSLDQEPQGNTFMTEAMQKDIRAAAGVGPGEGDVRITADINSALKAAQ